MADRPGLVAGRLRQPQQQVHTVAVQVEAHVGVGGRSWRPARGPEEHQPPLCQADGERVLRQPLAEGGARDGGVHGANVDRQAERKQLALAEELLWRGRDDGRVWSSKRRRRRRRESTV